MKIQKHIWVALILLLAVLTLCAFASAEFLQMRDADVFHPSQSLTRTASLGDYAPSLKGGPGDAQVFFFESGKPGATVLVLGGTHPNEAAGFIAAVLLLENIKVDSGKFIIVPQACSSGYTCTDPLEGYPQSYTLKSQKGERRFRFGSRVCNPLHQWPDPLVYMHYPSGQSLSGFETRNLNRSYPGKENGSFSEQVGYSILQLLKKEKVDIAFDLHEAAPEIPIINAIITHEKSKEIGASAILDLELDGLTYALEMSPKNFHGLSHREWGDSTEVLPFLMETSNPIQGRLRGITNQDLIVRGFDACYERALKSAKFRITYEGGQGEPLNVRVARHIRGIRAVLTGYNEYRPGKPSFYSAIPSYGEITKNGIGQYLK